MRVIVLVLATMMGVAVLAHEVFGLPWASAFALGAILGPTDAIAATAILRRFGVPRRIAIVVEGEALVNDATALVAYKVVVAAAVGEGFSASQAGLEFLGVPATAGDRRRAGAHQFQHRAGDRLRGAGGARRRRDPLHLGVSAAPRFCARSTRRPSQKAKRSTGQERIINCWAGMRGAVSLAAVLALPLTTDSGSPFPGRDLILFRHLRRDPLHPRGARLDAAVADPRAAGMGGR
jgi:NhaP-type Na+/H+ or K+/H+ antiporter